MCTIAWECVNSVRMCEITCDKWDVRCDKCEICVGIRFRPVKMCE